MISITFIPSGGKRFVVCMCAIPLDAATLDAFKGADRERLYAALRCMQEMTALALRAPAVNRPRAWRGILCSFDRFARQFGVQLSVPAVYTPEMEPWLTATLAAATDAVAHMRQSAGLAAH